MSFEVVASFLANKISCAILMAYWQINGEHSASKYGGGGKGWCGERQTNDISEMSNMVMFSVGWSMHLGVTGDLWTEFHCAIVISSECTQTAFLQLASTSFCLHNAIHYASSNFLHFHNIQHKVASFTDLCGDRLEFSICVVVDVLLAVLSVSILGLHSRNKDMFLETLNM